MRYKDAIIMVPGFFGFGRLGDFHYFADRLAASIRSTVKTKVGRTVPVLSISTEPTNGLAQRQRYLLDQLQIVDERLEGVERFHLFGHSTGGLDAELLTWDRSLADNPSWPEIDPREVRPRISSITTISTPFHGTHLCDSEVAGFLADPLQGRQGAKDAAFLVAAFGKMLGNRWLTADLLSGAAASWTSTARFLFGLLYYKDLIRDLRPERMQALRETCQRELSPQIVSFAVTAAHQPVRSEGLPREPDDFFRRIHAITGEGAPLPPRHEEIVELLEAQADSAIGHPLATVPKLDATISDGVVNTLRQVLLPESGHSIEVGGLVIADHADIIGHYDRQDPLSVGWGGRQKPINKGFFRSGCGFGDDEFFKLYNEIGSHIARAIEPSGPAKRRKRTNGSVAEQTT